VPQRARVIAASVVIALVADRLFGEVPRFHPLVGFGRVAHWVEARSRRWFRVWRRTGTAETPVSAAGERALGAGCWLLLVAVPTATLASLISAAGDVAAIVIGIVVLYVCIGGRSLAEHARAIAVPLAAGDLMLARQNLGLIVSRDTTHMEAPAITRATVESVLENGSDAVLAPVFWFVVAGAPGVLCYRLANTLDAMWGYRNARYVYFGCPAARMDDLLNWLPARCCALGYALGGRCCAALRSWNAQAAMCDSPNAGPVMAAGAGALGVIVGGTARYEGVPHWRPTLGEGRPAQPTDIARALALVNRATVIWLLVILVCEYLV
jgi:adenosylcobinamide-phosphate synthase